MSDTSGEMKANNQALLLFIKFGERAENGKCFGKRNEMKYKVEKKPNLKKKTAFLLILY